MAIFCKQLLHGNIGPDHKLAVDLGINYKSYNSRRLEVEKYSCWSIVYRGRQGFLYRYFKAKVHVKDKSRKINLE